MSGTKIKWDLQGFSWFSDELAKLGDHFDEAVLEALDAAAEPMVQDMREMVPFRTGALRDAIEAHSTQSDGIGSFYKTIGVDTQEHPEAFYVVMVEFGTQHSQAKPFIWPAYEKNKAKSTKIMGQVFKRWLSKYGFT
jgi:HK97 gp10 family phage protein